MKNNTKILISVGLVNLFTLIWCIVFTSLGPKTCGITFAIFCSELLSTITFQLRIYGTSKNKMNLAGVIGALSGMCGLFGILLSFSSILIDISSTNEIVNQLITFGITAVPIMSATYTGIVVIGGEKTIKNKKGIDQ